MWLSLSTACMMGVSRDAWPAICLQGAGSVLHVSGWLIVATCHLNFLQ